MYFEQITTPGLGCFSYAVGCPKAGVMAVADPRRDTGVYHRIAEENGMRITHIFDTHVHADHISGAQQLRAETGADIYIHENADIKYDAKKLKGGETFTLGNAYIRVLHTPGHTPNSISLLVSDLTRSSEPEMILTGDLLFVGDAGRPDLIGEENLDEQAANLYGSLYNTLGGLPDYLEVYPGHGQGSLCGRGMSAKPHSTLGYERLANPMLQFGEFADFKQAVTENLPMRPKSFSAIIHGNMNTIPAVSPSEDLTGYALSADEAGALLKDGATPLDLRDALSFGAAHIPGSINIDASSGAMLNWIGMAIPPGAPFILVLPADKRFAEMLLELRRIGYDRDIKGWLKDGISAWIDGGRETRRLPHISAQALRSRLAAAGSAPPVLLDVRSPQEFGEMNIKGSVNIPFDRLPDVGFTKDEEIIIVCLSGFRSGIAAGMLLALGYANVSVLSGGMGAWIMSGPVVITPGQAKAMMEDGDPYVLVDVRSESEFKCGYIEGAILIPYDRIADQAPTMLPDKTVRILVYCRSGNRSALAARTLAELGYAGVFDFGGLNNWTYGTVIQKTC